MEGTKEMKKWWLHIFIAVAIFTIGVLVVTPVYNVEAATKTKTIKLKEGQTYYTCGNTTISAGSWDAKYSIATLGKGAKVVNNKAPRSTGDTYKLNQTKKNTYGYITCEKGTINLKVTKNAGWYGEKVTRKKVEIKKGQIYKIKGTCAVISGKSAKYSYLLYDYIPGFYWEAVDKKKSSSSGVSIGLDMYKDLYIKSDKKTITVWVYGDKYSKVSYKKQKKQMYKTYTLQPNTTYGITFDYSTYHVTETSILMDAPSGTNVTYNYICDGCNYDGNIFFASNEANIKYKTIYMDEYDDEVSGTFEVYVGTEYNTKTLSYVMRNGKKVVKTMFIGEKRVYDADNLEYGWIKYPIANAEKIYVTASKEIKITVPTYCKWSVSPQ